MAKTFVLIDAHSLIYRSYFAFSKNPLKNSKGMTTSGIFGFLNTFEKIKQRFTTDYIALAFDAPGKTFRDEVYEEYKATRPPTPPDLPFQVEKVKEICRYLGITGFELEGYEADDILATCVVKLKKEGTIYIVTSDKDLMQLVDDTVFLYDAYKDIVYDRERVIQKFGVPPERIGEYLALTGDASDNIPGVPGIGPKRATAILKKYSRFEDMIVSEKKLVEYKEQALLSRRLVTLEFNVPLKITPEDLKIKPLTRDKLMPLLIDLELHSYIKTLSKTGMAEATSKSVDTVPPLKQGTAVAVFKENDEEIYFCIDENEIYKTSLKAAEGFLKNRTITKVGHDLKNLLKGGETEPPFFDVTIAAWLIDPNKRQYKLEDTVLAYLNEYLRMTPANAVSSIFKLYPILKKRLEELKELKLYQEIEEPLISVLARMEQRGICVDIDYLKGLLDEFNDEITAIQNKIYDLAGRRFNINSPKQLSTVLFEDLALRPSKKGKSHYSTRVEVLEQLSSVHPLPAQILKYREYTKIKSTYIEPLIAAARNGRVHTTFNQTGTATGRLSSSNPNIQNIPIRTAVGRRIRKGFIAEKGFLLVSADYSQIELRLLAHVSGDETLIRAFKEKKDIHTHTASLVFDIPEDKVDDKKRRMAKVVNYGLIYGMSDYGLARGLDISREQALQFIQSYYNLYPGVAEWRRSAVAAAEEKGYTETLLGRKRPLPHIHSQNHTLREFSKRAAINTPIQGTAADLIKIAMLRVEKELSRKGFKRGLLLSIHDELIFEIEAERIDEGREVIKECMEKALDLKIPIEVTIGTGGNWDEIH